MLLQGVRQRFGLELEMMTALPVEATGASLAALAQIMPLGLGMILYARTMQALRQGATRAALLPRFELARQAVAALKAALAQRSLTDGLAEDLVRVIGVEILICRAEAGDTASVTALAQGDAATAWRGFVGLVNAGVLAAANTLQTALGEVPATLDEGLQRDARLSLATLDLVAGDPARVPDRLQELALPPGRREALFLDAFVRLVNAGNYDGAKALLPRCEAALLQAVAPFSTAIRDGLFAAGILFLQARAGWPRSAVTFARREDFCATPAGSLPGPLF